MSEVVKFRIVIHGELVSDRSEIGPAASKAKTLDEMLGECKSKEDFRALFSDLLEYMNRYTLQAGADHCFDIDVHRGARN